MIVAETGDHVRFVTQPDHADLAGRFADHWGNERFDRPDPYPEVMIAAYNHDTGWWEYDRGPHLGEDGLLRAYYRPDREREALTIRAEE